MLTTAVVGCSLAYSVYDTKRDPAAAYFVTTTRMWELGIGGLLALAPRASVERSGAGLARLGGPRAGGRLGNHAERSVVPFPGWLALLPVRGAAALIRAAAGERAASGRRR